MTRVLPTLALAVVVCAAPAFAQNAALTDMMRTEQRFAARALVVGWKQAFLEYFADSAVGFDGEQAVPAKDAFRKLPDPPKNRKLLWEPRYGDVASSGDLGYLTGPVRRIVPEQNNGHPFHSVYASVWKRQADGSFKVVMDFGVPTPGRRRSRTASRQPGEPTSTPAAARPTRRSNRSRTRTPR